MNTIDPPGGSCDFICRTASCGDGVVAEGEACDDGDANSDVTPNSCRTSCRKPSCGDHVVDDGEMCDGDAACNETCRSRPNPTAQIPIWESDGTPIKQQTAKEEGCNLSGRGQSSDLTSLLWLTAVASVLARRRRRSARTAP